MEIGAASSSQAVPLTIAQWSIRKTVIIYSLVINVSDRHYAVRPPAKPAKRSKAGQGTTPKSKAFGVSSIHGSPVSSSIDGSATSCQCIHTEENKSGQCQLFLWTCSSTQEVFGYLKCPIICLNSGLGYEKMNLLDRHAAQNINVLPL